LRIKKREPDIPILIGSNKTNPFPGSVDEFQGRSTKWAGGLRLGGCRASEQSAYEAADRSATNRQDHNGAP